MKEHDPEKRELNPKAHLPQLKEAFPTPTQSFWFKLSAWSFSSSRLFGFKREGFEVC